MRTPMPPSVRSLLVACLLATAAALATAPSAARAQGDAVAAPEACKEPFLTPEQFNQKIGSHWAGILRLAGIREDAVIVEVGPGKQPKVGLGLQQFGFKGTLHVVEPDFEACRELVARYREMLPEATVIGHEKTLAGASDEIRSAGPVDAILANHVLDDMVIGETMSLDGINDYFSHFYGQNPDASRDAWDRLYASVPLTMRLKAMARDEWLRALETIRPRLLAMSQYKSYYFQKHRILPPDQLAYETLVDLKARLGQSPEEYSELLRQGGQDPDRWLVVKEPLRPRRDP